MVSRTAQLLVHFQECTSCTLLCTVCAPLGSELDFTNLGNWLVHVGAVYNLETKIFHVVNSCRTILNIIIANHIILSIADWDF